VGLNFKTVSSLLWLAMKIAVGTGTVKSCTPVATEIGPTCQRPKVATGAQTTSVVATLTLSSNELGKVI
jgi:hypothetical protein